jgi:hypothetical protein
MFEPENKLETLMQAAVRDPGAIPAFYKTLLNSEIYILTPEVPMTPGRRRSLKFEEKINVATVEFQGLKWRPAFTSKSRISAYLKEPETCLGAARVTYSRCCPIRIFGSTHCPNARSRCRLQKLLFC